MDEEVTTIPARKVRKIDLLILALDFAHDISAAVESVLDLGLQVACQHANYQVSQVELHAQMTHELETILKENE